MAMLLTTLGFLVLTMTAVWRHVRTSQRGAPPAPKPLPCPRCKAPVPAGAALCPACDAPFSSTFAVECEECGGKLREPELLGMRIRKPGK